MDDKTRKLLLAVINDEIEFWKALDNIDSRIGSTLSECIMDMLAHDDGWEIGAAKIVVDYLGIPELRTDAAPDVCDGDCREQNGCGDGERCGHVDDWLNDIGEDAEAYLDKLLEYKQDLLSGAKPQVIQANSPSCQNRAIE